MHIAIGGNIGSGKTTLTKILASHYNWHPHFEDVDDNPYLNDFYENMKRWSFNLQIYFLNSRLKQVIDIRKLNKTVIQDRTIYEDAHIFAPNLHSMNLLSTRDYNNYFALFETMSSLIDPPDLLIYLRASVDTILKQIKKRGRDYESNISKEYLTKLNERYEAWISNYSLGTYLIINVDNYNFPEQEEDRQKIFSLIDNKIKNLAVSSK